MGFFFVDGENDFSRTKKDLEGGGGGDKEVILASSPSSFLCGYGFGIFPAPPFWEIVTRPERNKNKLCSMTCGADSQN